MVERKVTISLNKAEWAFLQGVAKDNHMTLDKVIESKMRKRVNELITLRNHHNDQIAKNMMRASTYTEWWGRSPHPMILKKREEFLAAKEAESKRWRRFSAIHQIAEQVKDCKVMVHAKV